jgi:2-methylisocitrate lyase-like PEP mutase family enzyme
MKTSHTTQSPARLAVAVLLSQLLERLDRSAVPVGAEQYRSVVRHLQEEFEELGAQDSLSALLDAYPSAAELYENLNYRHAGLCRSPLEQSLDAELRARQVIERARRGLAG